MKSLSNNNSGKKLLTDQCEQIKISDVFKRVKTGYIRCLKEKMVVNGGNISLKKSSVNNGGVRYWFACPLCGVRCGILYKSPLGENIGCRKCLNLDYRSRRYKGMIENIKIK